MKAHHAGLIGRIGRKERNRNKHKKLGLCVDCSQRAVDGKKCCQFHLDYHNKKTKEYNDSN